METRVITQFNFKAHTKRIVFSKEDRALTVPDQAYSLTQLIERHRAGILTDTAFYKEPVYLDTDDFDDEDMEKLANSDLTDQEEYMRRASELNDEIEQKDRDIEQKSKSKDRPSAKDKSSAAKSKQPEGKGLSETEQPGASQNGSEDEPD